MWEVPKSFQRSKRKQAKRVRDRYKNLSEEEKEKTRLYHRGENKNLSEEEKQKKVEYMRNYYLRWLKGLKLIWLEQQKT